MKTLLTRTGDVARQLVGPVLHPYADRIRTMNVIGGENVPADAPGVIVSRYVNESEDPIFLSSALRSLQATDVLYIRYPTANGDSKGLREKMYDHFSSVEYHRPSDLRGVPSDVRSTRQTQNKAALDILGQTISRNGHVIVFPEGISHSGQRAPFTPAFFQWGRTAQQTLGKPVAFLPAAVSYNGSVTVRFGEATYHTGERIRDFTNDCFERVTSLEKEIS